MATTNAALGMGRRGRRSDRQLPHEDSRIAVFLRQQIDKKLAGVKTQREIADELGYRQANIISMMKNGEIKVPLDKVFPLALAIGVDPGHLFRLALEQWWPGGMRELNAIFRRTATEREERLLAAWREATADFDPHIDEEFLHDFRQLIAKYPHLCAEASKPRDMRAARVEIKRSHK